MKTSTSPNGRQRPRPDVTFMTHAEILRIIIMVAVLLGALGLFMTLSEQLTQVPPAPPRATDAPMETEALSSAEAKRLADLQAMWDTIRTQAQLPAGATPPTSPPAIPPAKPEPVTLNAGLLDWVDDGTEERESAPLRHLLNYSLSRSHEQLLSLAVPRPDLPRGRWTNAEAHDSDRETLFRYVKDNRGKVHSIKGYLLDMYPRAIDDPKSPVKLVWDAIISDRDQQVYLVICADKDRELVTGTDVVWAVGPLFKLLRVETRDPNPDKRFKAFPVIVCRSLRKIDTTPPPRDWRTDPVVIIGLSACLIVFVGMVIRAVVLSRRKPQLGRKRHARAAMNNDSLRQLDKTRSRSTDAADSTVADGTP